MIHSPSWRRLQGKTQLFPSHESDFFRNRLTHSLEVSQIAEGIAIRLNHVEERLKDNRLSSRLCATAGLMHDLGHPPFGHNGEHALDGRMRDYGGFEGNAQTLRIIARLEKKVRALGSTGDQRRGLNLAYRTIAAALKYDRLIPATRKPEDKLVKGYYGDEADLIERVKDAVVPQWRDRKGKFKTVECSIMDLADDIAYSTYDLEDSLKAGFLTPGSIISSDDELLQRVASKVSVEVGREVETAEVLSVLIGVFDGLFDKTDAADTSAETQFIRVYRASETIASAGHTRTELTSQLVNAMIKAVVFEYDEEFPPLSRVYLTPEAHLQVEVLKNYTFEAMISSTRLKVAEYRGSEIVETIFDALSEPRGRLLMPSDARAEFDACDSQPEKEKRVICDFIAGMTDRYAIEFYSRLKSNNGETIFKPVG